MGGHANMCSSGEQVWYLKDTLTLYAYNTGYVACVVLWEPLQHWGDDWGAPYVSLSTPMAVGLSGTVCSHAGLTDSKGSTKGYQAPGPKSSRHLLSKHWSHGPHGCHSAPTSLPESITLPTGRLEHIKSIPINELLNLFPLDVWPDRNPLTLHFCWANS